MLKYYVRQQIVSVVNFIHFSMLYVLFSINTQNFFYIFFLLLSLVFFFESHFIDIQLKSFLVFCFILEGLANMNLENRYRRKKKTLFFL